MDITLLTDSLLRGADELRRLAGWNQTAEDWRRLLALEPEGCFAAMDGSEVIGTVTTTTYGQQLAWIGMMLVHPNHRRRGVGTLLMRTALDFLQQRRGIDCIRLDATPAGYPVYQKLGFVPEWTLTRHQALSASAGNSANTRDVTELDWPAVEELDAAAFGATRLRVLRSFVQGSRVALVWPAEGRVLGYGMLRAGSQCDYLGPLVCSSADGLDSLVSALLNTRGPRPIFWDVPDQNALAIARAKRFGFTPVRPLARMRLGPDSVPSSPTGQLAIVDPSVG